MNVLEDGPSMMKNPSAMLTELEGMARSGETPAFDLITTIKTLILDEIMPSLKITRDAAAEATTEALREIRSCNNKSKTEEVNIAKNRQKSVENARSLHGVCREAEKALFDHNLTHSDSYCVRLGKFLHGAGPLEIVAGSTRDSSVGYVKWASSTNMCNCTKVTELEGMARSGETPAFDLITTIKTLILDEIMPSLKITRDAAAEATTEALREIRSCNNKSKTEEVNIAKNRQKSVENARSLHGVCREA